MAGRQPGWNSNVPQTRKTPKRYDNQEQAATAIQSRYRGNKARVQTNRTGFRPKAAAAPEPPPQEAHGLAAELGDSLAPLPPTLQAAAAAAPPQATQNPASFDMRTASIASETIDTLWAAFRAAPDLEPPAGFKTAYSVSDGLEGDRVKDPSSSNYGKRFKNGWKNSDLPWGDKINPELLWIPNGP